MTSPKKLAEEVVSELIRLGSEDNDWTLVDRVGAKVTIEQAILSYGQEVGRACLTAVNGSTIVPGEASETLFNATVAISSTLSNMGLSDGSSTYTANVTLTEEGKC